MLPDYTIGVISLWYGEIAAIPPGWHLCDGTNGTPDLRDRFIIGAGSTYNPYDTGAAPQHAHTLTTDSHIHHFPAGSDIYSPPSGPTPPSGFAAITTDTATTDPTNHLPPWHQIVYMQFLG